MITSSDIALVRLYYENFGLSAAEVSSALEMSKPVVESLITEHNMVAPEEAKMAADKRAALVARDLDKQMALEPYYARAEVIILTKLTELAQSINAEDLDAGQKMAICSRALKDLKSAGVQAKLDSTTDVAGVTVQILNQL